MSVIIDITGEKFGRLTAIRYTGRKTVPGGNAISEFKCDCGKVIERPRSMLKHANTPSCGCYISERAGKLNKTHGGRNERLYLVWMDMRRRCYDKNDANYKNYGGRGIKVCEEWKDYAVFRSWANDTGYDPNARHSQCTIDRIDNNGDYCPQNCRWADSKTQNNNRRNNKIVEFSGRKQTLKMWADELGLNYHLVCTRLEAGWEVEKAFLHPSSICKKQIIHG